MGQPRSLVPSLVTWSNFSMRRASRCIPSLYKWWTPGYSSSSNMFPTHRQTRDEFIVCEIFLSTKLTLSIDNFIKEDGSGVHLGLHFSGRDVIGISDTIVLFEKPMVVSYRLSIVITDYWAIYNHPAAICHWLSPTLKSTEGGSVWDKVWWGRGWLTWAKFWSNMRDTWAVVCRRNRVDIFCHLTTMHECDRQTNHRTVTSI